MEQSIFAARFLSGLRNITEVDTGEHWSPPKIQGGGNPSDADHVSLQAEFETRVALPHRWRLGRHVTGSTQKARAETQWAVWGCPKP